MTEEDIVKIFEAEIENDPSAYERPGECVYQITAKELVKSAREIERRTLEQAAEICRNTMSQFFSSGDRAMHGVTACHDAIREFSAVRPPLKETPCQTD